MIILKKYDIEKISIGQGDDFTTGFLLDYPDFKEHKKLFCFFQKER